MVDEEVDEEVTEALVVAPEVAVEEEAAVVVAVTSNAQEVAWVNRQSALVASKILKHQMM